MLFYLRRLTCAGVLLLATVAQADAPASFEAYADCSQPAANAAIAYPPGGSAAYADQHESNYHVSQSQGEGPVDEESGRPCVVATQVLLEATDPVAGFNPFQVNQLAQVNQRNPANQPANPGPGDGTVFGNFNTQCQPEPGNPHVAIDNLQGSFVVTVSQQGGFFRVSGLLPFGSYQSLFSSDPLDGPPIGVGGSFEIGGVPNAPALANIQFSTNPYGPGGVNFAMAIQRGIGVLPGGAPSVWQCFGEQI